MVNSLNIIFDATNESHSIINTIKSIKEQNLGNLELLVLYQDNDVFNLFKRYDIYNTFIRYDSSKSIQHQLNKMIDFCQADYVMFCDHRTVFFQNRIKLMLDTIKNKNVDCVFGKSERIISGKSSFLPDKFLNVNDKNYIFDKPFCQLSAKIFKRDRMPRFDDVFPSQYHWEFDIKTAMNCKTHYINTNISVEYHQEDITQTKEFEVEKEIINDRYKDGDYNLISAMDNENNSMVDNNTKIAVYSSITTDIFGKKDNYFLKSRKFDNIDYYLFTDNPNKFVSENVKIIKMESEYEEQIKKICNEVEPDNLKKQKLELQMKSQEARILAPIKYKELENYEICLWMDGRLALIENPTNLIKRYYDYNILFYLFEHPTFSMGCDIFNELDEWDRQDKCSRIACENVRKFYREINFQRMYGLWGGGVQIFNTANKDINKYLQLYWDLIVSLTTADQLALPYLLKYHGVPYKTIGKQFDGDVFDKHFKEGLHLWY